MVPSTTYRKVIDWKLKRVNPNTTWLSYQPICAFVISIQVLRGPSTTVFLVMIIAKSQTISLSRYAFVFWLSCPDTWPLLLTIFSRHTIWNLDSPVCTSQLSCSPHCHKPIFGNPHVLCHSIDNKFRPNGMSIAWVAGHSCRKRATKRYNETTNDLVIYYNKRSLLLLCNSEKLWSITDYYSKLGLHLCNFISCSCILAFTQVNGKSIISYWRLPMPTSVNQIFCNLNLCK